MANEEINFEVTGFGALRQQLKEAQLEMIKLAEAGKEGTAEFIKAAQKVGTLKEAIKDAADSANVFTTEGKFQAVTKSLGAIAGGFTAIQGAISLVDSDTKAFEETFKKLQAAMALTQGLTALADLGDAFKNLKNVAVGAFNGIKAAIGSTGIGLLIIGLGVAVQQLVSYFNDQEEAEKKVKNESEILNRQLQDLKTTYDLLGQSIDNTSKIEVARAELAGKSAVEIAKIEKKRTEDLKKSTENQITETANQYEALLRANAGAADAIGAEAQAAEFQRLSKERDDRLGALNKELEDRKTAVTLAGLAIEKAEKDTNKKVVTDNKASQDKIRAQRMKALEDQKNLDLALLEQEKLKVLAKETDENEKLKIEQKYKEKSLNVESQFEINKESLRSKDEKSAVALKARLQDLDNQSVENAVKTEEEIAKNKEKAAEEEKKRLADLEEKRKQAAEDQKRRAEEEYQNTLKYLDKYFNEKETAIRKEELTEEELKKKLDALELEKLEAKKTAANDYVATVEKASFDVVDVELEKQKKLDEINQKEVESSKKAQQAKINSFKEYADTVIQTAQAVTDAFAAQNEMRQQQEIEAVKASAKSEEEKAKAIDDIKKNYFEKNKSIEIANAIISSISGALNAFVSTLKIDPTGITGSILAAAALATGYFQVEKIRATTYESSLSGSNNKTPQGSMYAEGGLLMGRSHDMGGIKTAMGELEGGEFVMNRRATANFLPLLQAINSQGNTPGPQIPQYQNQVIKTYVVATDVTSQQEANAKLTALARL